MIYLVHVQFRRTDAQKPLNNQIIEFINNIAVNSQCKLSHIIIKMQYFIGYTATDNYLFIDLLL